MKPILCSLVLALSLSPTALEAQDNDPQSDHVAAASTGAPIDFRRAYALALEADPTWLAAQARQRADAQERAIARAGLRPSLSYSYDRSRNWSNIRETYAGQSVGQDITYNSFASSFMLSQSLFNAAAGARYKAGVARGEAARFTEERARQALAVRVLQAYTDLLYALDDLTLAQGQVTALDEDARRVERFVVLGEGTRTDRTEVEAQQHLAAAKLLEAQDRLRTARNGLRILLGLVSAGDPAPLNERCLPLVGQPEPLALWKERMLAHNPELAAERSMIQVAERQVQEARAAGLPTVAAYARHRTSESDTENVIGQHYRTASVGIQVRVPLYSGGGVSAAATQARNALEEARYKLDAATFELVDDLEKQFNLVEMSPMRMDAYARASSAAAERVHATERSIAGGERTNLDVLDAERQRLEARRDLARARYDYLLGWLSLRWQAGTLEDADIDRVAACFTGPRP
ncbi:TolC family outer membrane protein [Sphingomonas sp. H39-1-10]|uniref:TolC family outer membrane protein n=1 Tax=Sphingomonas pollutisoli TaxID=3030829 RepID=UPI0023B89CAF|nr:TolC family outer membrane protein [Sphingomonas pollutisoli]MDF0490295.1 TolC family outer membrane protein [Sphingomonas pollutisoli]